MATTNLPEQSPAPANGAMPDRERDLGFGTSLSNRKNFRLLNHDGSFNVRRHRPNVASAFFSYTALISMAWRRFIALVVVIYLAVNSVFAIAYLLCGPSALEGDPGVSGFARAFFFSVHTFATIGYGNPSPHGLAANILVTIESLVGLMSFALLAGLVFARFSRPTAHIIYSDRALMAPYGSGKAFMFRIMNGRDNELVEVQANLVLSRFEASGVGRQRRYYQLPLERNRVAFFPLNWTIVHSVDPGSPLYGWDEQMMREAEAEFLILLTAIDETFAQTVHNRGSYTSDEVVWNARFLPLVEDDTAGPPSIRPERFHNFERVP
jgi:inward rectifier potassium channel